jgi:hypothetical protein
MQSSNLLHKNEQFYRKQAEILLGTRSKWLRSANGWAALAEQIDHRLARPAQSMMTKAYDGARPLKQKLRRDR